MISERELQEAYAGTRVVLETPRVLLRRLELVARLLREVPEDARSRPQVVWLDVGGKVGWAGIGEVPLLVGRDAACGVVLSDPKVSRRHCQVRRVERGSSVIAVDDLGSSNGTRVNGVRLAAGEHRLLAEGDVIEVGGVPLVVIREPVQ